MKIIVTLLLLTGVLPGAWAQEAVKKVCFGNTCIEAEIARSYEKRSLGLMHRKDMPDNAGMLFIFEDNDFHRIWMKNMLIPLDIIWIDQDKRVAHIAPDAKPCADKCDSYKSPAKSPYILEVNAGFAKKNNIKPGDQVTFN